MVNGKKKSNPKRITLKQKSKVLKKVKAHHVKKAKEAKKTNGNSKQSHKLEREPDLSEQEIRDLQARRARDVEQLEHDKAARKDKVRKRNLGLLDDDDLQALADKKQNVGMDKETETFAGAGKNRDNSDRAFYKELAKVIEVSDVILEVLDARDPLGTRCVDMEKMVMKSGPDKRLLLVLNKIDLVPREIAEKWLKYLREEIPAVAFKCSTQEQRSNLGWKSSKSAKASKSSNLLSTSDCLGAETLIKLLKNYSRSHESMVLSRYSCSASFSFDGTHLRQSYRSIKKSITVGVIGLPNVGKSSLINSLKRSHVVNVGATPGLTRSMQEVHLDKNVKLLDCPGVVMLKSSESDASIALRNCKRIEKLADPVAPVKEILKLCPAKMLVTIYKVPDFTCVDDFLQKVALVRGKLKKGGIVDVDAAARIVLHDWNEGKIPYYTIPPIRNQGECSEARIVTQLSKEFNIDEVYNSETSFIGSLKSVDDFLPEEAPPSCPLTFDETMVEGSIQQEASAQGDQTVKVDNVDQPMGNEEEEEADVEKSKIKTAAFRQNEKLYGAEGMLNTKMKKAAEKRRKKASKLTSVDAMDDDEDHSKNKGSAMDVGMDHDDAPIDAKVPFSGIELPEE
ncbi:hypothetical protein ACFE04_002449 [Oxalis oulophora]